MVTGRRNKYGNTRSWFAGRRFDSKLEMERYLFLQDAERRGLISGLRCQVPFELFPQWKRLGKVYRRATTYVADFTYGKDGVLVIEDTKGYETDVFRLKEVILHFLLGKDIRKVRKATEDV